MALPDPSTRSIPARNAVALLHRLEAAGLPRALLLADTGFDPDSLAPEDRISAVQEVRLLRNAVAAGLPAGFGFNSQFNIDAYGLMGYAMMACATLRQAITIAMRYYMTAGPLIALRFFVQGNEAVIEAEDELGLGDVLPTVMEQLFAGLSPLMTQLLGQPVMPVRVQFAYAQPDAGALQHYRAALPCPMAFGTATSQYCVPKHLLDAPLAAADPDSARMFEQQCRALLEQIQGQETLAGQISRHLLAHPGALPDAETMAGRLNMGVRTMRRRLASDGSSYRALLDEVRKRMAMDYLQSTHLSSQEVAELLGFTEATNFRRAFLRWTGDSPARFRRRAAGTPASSAG